MNEIDKNELLKLLMDHLSISVSADRNWGDFYPDDGKEFITLNISLNWFDEEKKESIILSSERVTV